MLHDPDGHEVRFYTDGVAHRDRPGEARWSIDDAIATARAKEKEWRTTGPPLQRSEGGAS